MPRTLQQHLDPDVTPKRILALDGGGIRGLISLGILEDVERRLGSPLSDHFDLIGGTSTGAIIATELAMGETVGKVISLYEKLGSQVFRRSLFPLRFGAFRAKFDAAPLVAALQEELGGVTLGSPQVQTGLAIVCKRLDSGSPWVLYNNPKGKYYNAKPGSGGVANSNLELTTLLRASTAAPHFFDPIEITVAQTADGGETRGLFVDGGVSPHNNPSLQLLLLATLEGHRFDWKTGADRLQLVSIGTGTWKPKEQGDRGWRSRLVNRIAAAHALESLTSMMYDASALNELLLQALSESPTARKIDAEVGDLAGQHFRGPPAADDRPQPVLNYLRYDAPLEANWLAEHMPEMNISGSELKALRAMDNPDNINRLVDIGRAAAAEQIADEHWVL